MTWEEAGTAAALGLLEGLTEFIPVSSTGHLLLAGHFLGWQSTARVFEVAIQMGAILAIVWVYAARLVTVLSTAHRDPVQRRFALSVLLAFLPAAVLGVVLHPVIKTVLFETPTLIAVMLILGGIVLLVVDRRAPIPRHPEADRLPWRTSLGIGLFQTLALVPGVSRSGATIVGALMLRVERRAAAEFSFFLSLPTMAGAVTFDLWQNRAALSLDDLGLIAIGFVAAFASGLLVVRTLLAFVARHGFAFFGWWRIIVGSLALLALSA
ncbi:undecaprenyl-diphosphate phosphatase [Rubellimicrobium sp. CFH 75288]|uniref:undecaprenyl-diphosphate phosphatase n=1 Tax=Rubellimicrobium sp. CFH 75288 TaxID=2697034 RepID=UPI0014123033|nr:undecaprenyl-diphosphate phosphatase [Rubellimicrobium sp. CFH 75288]NAZ37715.1 undecaprenyl-diphosphate phosphatase [Rubellimicrobium sp. CFH 75288]